MMVAIWSKHCERRQAAAGKDAIGLNLDDMPNHDDMPTNTSDYNDEEHDPFGIGMCDLAGNDLPTANQHQSTTYNQPNNDPTTNADTTFYSVPELQQRYPAYNWTTVEEEDVDAAYKIDLPEHPDLRQLSKVQYRSPWLTADEKVQHRKL